MITIRKNEILFTFDIVLNTGKSYYKRISCDECTGFKESNHDGYKQCGLMFLIAKGEWCLYFKCAKSK